MQKRKDCIFTKRQNLPDFLAKRKIKLLEDKAY
jgi:hypothetical protein